MGKLRIWLRKGLRTVNVFVKTSAKTSYSKLENSMRFSTQISNLSSIVCFPGTFELDKTLNTQNNRAKPLLTRLQTRA